MKITCKTSKRVFLAFSHNTQFNNLWKQVRYNFIQNVDLFISSLTLIDIANYFIGILHWMFKN